MGQGKDTHVNTGRGKIQSTRDCEQGCQSDRDESPIRLSGEQMRPEGDETANTGSQGSHSEKEELGNGLAGKRIVPMGDFL